MIKAPLHQTLGVHTALILVTGIFLFPLVWMTLTALKPIEQAMKSPPEWIPRVWTAPLDTGTAPRAAPRPLAECPRVPVDRVRQLESGEAMVLAGRAEGEAPGQGRLEGQRLLVKLEDVRLAAGEWGRAGERGPGEMRLRLGIEREKLVVGCEVLQIFEAPERDAQGQVLNPWWQVREYVPDVRQTGGDEKAAFAWNVVPEAELRQEARALWQNIPAALNKMDFWRMLLNTLWVCVLGMVGTTAASALAAYGLAFGRFPGRGALFALTLATMMVPFPATMVPLYQLYRDLGWIGTFKPLWVPCWCGAAFNIFLLRQFFMGLPKDLLDAARIDGCSELEIFWHVVMPLARPALAMVALFHFLYAWKDFMAPLLYLSDRSQYTLSVGLQAFQSQQGGTPWHLVMAASAVFSLPLVVLFLLAMKTFIRGIAMTGIKG